MRNADDDDDGKTKSDEQDAVKIAAFLWIRKVMFVSDRSLKELCLKVCMSYDLSNNRLHTLHS